MVDEDFVWMAKNALDHGHSFGIDELPQFIPAQPGRNSAPELIQELALRSSIEALKSTAGVTDEMRARIYQLACTSEACYNVITRILRKDLRCGVAAKTINKVSPNLIFRVGYQRCASASYVDKIKYAPGAILQRKANGMFAYLLPDGTFMTRKGERSSIPGNPIAPYVAGLPGLNDKVIAQELGVIGDDGKFLPRAISNGLINSFFQGGGDPEVAKRIRSYAWLYLTPEEFYANEGSEAYRYVWDNLTAMLPLNGPMLPIESWYVSSFEEAMTKTKELIRAGEEGTVLKSMNDSFVWRDEDPSYFQVKLKAEAVCEFVVIDAYEGDAKKKYAGLLGGITVRSKDGVIVTNVGGGFSDSQRKLGVDHWRSKAGSIVSVKFNGITEPNEFGVRALDHPNLVEERPDKTEADSYEYCRDALLGVI